MRNPFLVAAYALTLASRDEGLIPGELAELCRITIRSANRCLTALTRAGFLARQLEANDRYGKRFLYTLSMSTVSKPKGEVK